MAASAAGGGGPTRARSRAETGPPLRRRLIDLALVPVRVAASFPGGRRRLLRRIVIVNLVDATSLWVLAGPLPGITVESWPAAFVVTVVAALVSVFVRPILLFVVQRFGALAFLLTFLLNAIAIRLADGVVPGVTVSGLLPALGAAVGVAVGNTIISWVLSLDEDESFYGHLMRRLARDRGLVDTSQTPGVLFIQVDGLSAPVLRNAVRTGRMPFVAGLLRSGSHRLHEWRCHVPSMTSASQAGILHGHDDDIPAFRWYEKSGRRLVVSNHPADAAEMERRIGGHGDELLSGGTSVSNLFSGGAARSVLTASTLDIGPGLLFGGRASTEFYPYLVNPYNLIRGLVLSVGVILLEWYQARRERVRDIRPRMDRGGAFPILRAVSSIFLRDLATAAVVDDLQRGAPVVYVDCLNYDEIAHHAAPERGEAMRELEAVDRQVRTLVLGAQDAPRPYRIVVLSDHGQSVGPTFRDRTGLGLDELIAQLMHGEGSVGAAMADVEGYGRLNALLTSFVAAPGVGARVARRALGRRTRDGLVELGPGATERRRVAAEPEVVVCASGNLALVYFTEIPGRASLEAISAGHPGLVERLAAHDGIGFVMVRSEAGGPLVLGPQGIRALEDDRVEGVDPLAPFGPEAADELRRLDAMSRVGDLLVNSIYDPETEEVASFEKLIGCHGGLGGPQTRPFLLAPATWDLGAEPLVGGAVVNRRLREAMAVDAASAAVDLAVTEAEASRG
jgi:uncharacterized membrane protein YvlD (DUF360 family)